MENNKELVDSTKKIIEGLSGILNTAKTTVDKNIEQLKKSNPEEAVKQIKAYSDAMTSGNLDEVISDLQESLKKLNGAFNGY